VTDEAVPDPEQRTCYIGKRFWPVTAATSLFGTTSCLLSILVANHIPPLVQAWGAFLLCLFFLAAVLMSLLGGTWLLLSNPSEDVGVLILRGRSVPTSAWRTVLLICYLAPWLALGIAFAAAHFSRRPIH